MPGLGLGLSFTSPAVLRRSGAAFVGLLDQVGAASAGAWSTWSRRKATHLGAAIRVCDAALLETDIGFGPDNLLDEAALAAAAAGGTLTLSKIYDQSGSGRDMLQAIKAAQPRIVNGGVIDKINGKPCAVFARGVSTMSTAAFTAYTGSSLALAMGLRRDDTTGSFARVFSFITPGQNDFDSVARGIGLMFPNSTALAQTMRNGVTAGLTVDAAAANAVFSEMTSAGSNNLQVYSQDGAGTPGTSAGAFNVTIMTIGLQNTSNAVQTFGGVMTDAIAFFQYVSSGDRATLLSSIAPSIGAA